jgi:hypothetical protein
MKDEKVRYRAAELHALVAGKVRVFCLTAGNLRAEEMARCFLRHRASSGRHALSRAPLWVESTVVMCEAVTT